jgi:RNA polymerase sigma-70 factor, ECF subfamily
MQDISLLLHKWSEGDPTALDKLTPIVYDELHRIAHGYMTHERDGHTLQTTALVNEVYLRLVKANQVQWHDRVHFFAIAARLMRRVLVDFARSRAYEKRGGGTAAVSLDEALTVSADAGEDLVRVDEALASLAEFDPRKVQVVELRFFGGLTVAETAEVLKIAPITVKREWEMAKLWLLDEMTRE